MNFQIREQLIYEPPIFLVHYLNDMKISFGQNSVQENLKNWSKIVPVKKNKVILNRILKTLAFKEVNLLFIYA